MCQRHAFLYLIGHGIPQPILDGAVAMARGYFALDITDPFEPKFLWQYTHPQLGQTYGQPRMAPVNVEFATGGIHQRTVAILPGGWGGGGARGRQPPK